MSEREGLVAPEGGRGGGAYGSLGPAAKAPSAPPARWMSTEALTTFRSVVGSGSFALPFALRRAGLVGGAVVAFAVTLLTVRTTKQLVASAALVTAKRGRGGGVGLVELAEEAFAQRAWVAVMSATLILSQFIAVCTYVVFVTSTLTPMLEDLLELEDQGARVELGVVGGVLCLEMVLALPANPAFLENVSVFGNTAFFASVAFMVGDGLLEHTPRVDNMAAWKPVEGMWFCFGISSFMLSAHAECVAIFDSAPPRQQARYERIVGEVTWLASAIYMVVAVLCYACFGEATKEIILNNFSGAGAGLGGRITARVLQVSICIMICCNFPLTLFPLHQLVEAKLGLNTLGSHRLSAGQVLSRFMLIVCSGLVAVLCGRRFGTVSAIGLVAFVFPPIIYMQLTGGIRNQTRTDLALDACVLLLGLVGSLQSLAGGLQSLAA